MRAKLIARRLYCYIIMWLFKTVYSTLCAGDNPKIIQSRL